ncbi:unnamed protein product [Mytilus edulis]|uniref:Uncharacterized protein n=1 Tax=Mytilus edulis TaxID=6550 RepID=A0A8S3SRP0_MYTED|nr:unnamed protein product [Mytilus edulis]
MTSQRGREVGVLIVKKGYGRLRKCSQKNKITRNHNFISIADYRKIEHVSISQVCEHHGENLEWFCKNHDKALCMGIRSIVSETKSITDSIDSSEDYELKVDINRRITKLSKEVQAFGQIKNGRLYVVSAIATIQVLDLSGRQLETLKIASNRVINLTSSKNMIFYTDCNSNKVHCCLMNGDELWQFESKNIIYPFNATVDNSDNVYVVSSTAYNLTIIQNNGKVSKTLLKESDGLNRPQALYYDNEKRTLLICKEGTAALYRLD